MALSTYAELKASVSAWIHRTGDATMDAIVPDLITLAEEAISADLVDCPAMWSQQAGIALGAGESYFTLPATVVGLRALRGTAPSEFNVPVKPYSFMTRLMAQGSSDLTGRPHAAALARNEGGGGLTRVTVYPAADQAYTLTAECSAGVVALSDGNTTNFILTRAPALYLFGALKEAEPFLVNDERVALWEAKYRAAVERFLSLPWAGEMMMGSEVTGIVGGRGFDINLGE